MKRFLAILLTPLLAFADPSVDIFQDMETSTDGTSINSSIATAGSHGSGGSWSVTGTQMKIKTAGERALRGPITVVGIGSPFTDSGSTRGWGWADDIASQYATYTFPSAKSAAVFSGYLTVNQPINSDDIHDTVNVGNGSVWAVMQIRTYDATTLEVWIESTTASTIHSTDIIPLTRGNTYWYSFKVNPGSSRSDLTIYNASTWALVGTANCAMNSGTINMVRYGRADSHPNDYATTTSYLDDICISWTDVTYPFLPSAASGGPPTISVQPVGSTNSTAGGFSLSVTAGGDVPLRYQWRTNSVNVSGATNSTYGSAPATTNQSGSYTVVITNASGSITSSVATVSITNSTAVGPPTIAGIPVERLSTNAWRNAGIPGGIPVRTTVYTNLSPGVTAAQIKAAINACPSNQVVQLAAGTYNISFLSVGVKDGWTLRGAGMGQTIINVTNMAANTPAFAFGGSPPWDGSWDSTVNITGTLPTMGQTNLTVSSATSYSIGDHVVIDMVNADWIVGYGAGGYGTNKSYNYDSAGKLRDGNRVQLHYAVVTAKSGNDLTFWPPLPYALESGRTPQLTRFGNTGGTYRGPKMAGIEDLTFNCPGSTDDENRGVDIIGTHSFWLKNVEIKNWGGLAAIYARRASCLEIRGCWIHAPAIWINSHGYGIQLDPVSGSLIEDNIIYDCISNFLLQGGCAGNVIAYNVSAFGKYVDSSYSGEWLQHEISLNHTPFPCYNLMEGNYTAYVQSDYYYGPSGWTTILRNRLPGNSSATTLHRLAVAIDSNQRYYSVVGNQIGEVTAPSSLYLTKAGVTETWAQPGAITWYYAMAGDNASYTKSYLYRLGYPFSGRNDTNYGAYGGRDTTVLTNTVINANWDAVNLGVTYDASGDTTVPDSFYLDSKPAFFKGLAWPPYGPSAPGGTSNEIARLPAGWRLLNNVDPPAANPPTNGPVITQVNASGSVGTYFYYAAVASNDPDTWGSSNLPSGLTMTGNVIDGVPTSGTTNLVTLWATNIAGFTNATVTFSIAAQETRNYLGNTNNGSSLDILYPNDISGAQYTALGTFIVSNINVKVEANTGYFKCAIYSATSNLLGQTEALTNTVYGWTNFTLAAPVSITNGSVYWIYVWSSGLSYVYYSDTGVPAIRYQTVPMAAWPSVLVLTNSGAGLNYCAYADGSDFEGPALTITAPANEFDTVFVDSVTFAGTSSDPSGVATVTATNLTTGAAITIAGTESWTGTATGLALGLNQLAVTATDNGGNISTATIYSNYQLRRRVIQTGRLRLP